MVDPALGRACKFLLLAGLVAILLLRSPCGSCFTDRARRASIKTNWGADRATGRRLEPASGPGAYRHDGSVLPPRSPLDPDRHAAEALFAANSEDREGRMWTDPPWGPFADFDTYLTSSRAVAANTERLTFAIVDTGSAKAVGVASYLNIKPASGSIEVGALAYSPALQQRRASTEAMFLMMRRVFDEMPVSALRVEDKLVQQIRLARRGAPARVQIRGDLSPGRSGQGPQP